MNLTEIGDSTYNSESHQDHQIHNKLDMMVKERKKVLPKNVRRKKPKCCIKCNKCWKRLNCNPLKLGLALLLYFYLYYHIIFSLYLYRESEQILDKYNIDYFPTHCESYMKQCARVYFNKCVQVSKKDRLTCRIF